MKLTNPKTMKCCVIENERLIMDSNENWKWNAEPISEMRQTNIQQIIWQHFKQAYANIGFRHENKWK